MATNFYFQPFPQAQITDEQLLVEDLVIEAMGIYGMDVYYLPRSSGGTEDMLYGEDTMKQYRSAHPIEMYLENITGMDGEQDFISKFGLEIRDEITLLVSRRRFKYTVGATNFQTPILGDITPEENRAPTRPREGDLVYLPLLQNFFEITFVEHENDQAMFYTLGRGRGGNVYVYSLKLKQYVFSEEIIETGITEIDEQVFDAYKRTRLTVNLTGGSGAFVPGEIIYQGTTAANADVQAIVHTWQTGQYVDVIRTQGTFVANVRVKGAESNSTWVLTSSNDKVTLDNAFEDIADNNRIETESDLILDWTETNPFGGD